MHNKSRSYLNKVIEQIKSKEAKQYVAAELSHHLKAAKQNFIKNGLPEQEAEEKAIEQMGNPSKLGMQMNKLHRPKVDWIMISVLLATVGLGFLPMLTLDSAVADMYLRNKAIIVLLGLLVTFGFMFLDYRKLMQYKWIFFSLGILILLLLHIGPVTYINGYPYLRIGPLSIESTATLPLFYLFWAAFFKSERISLWQTGLYFAISLFMFLSLPGLSVSFIYIAMVFVMLWWSNLSFKKIIGATLSFFVLLGGAVFIGWSSIVLRTAGFFNPEQYSDTSGYFYLLSKELMLSAGWFGNSAKGELIPESHTDFVFVNFTYHYGWLLAGVLVIVLAFIAARMLLTYKKINHSFGQMLIIGGVTLFSLQFLYHIATALGWLPFISMSLPFISYGLMPTILNSIIVGLFLSVYLRKDLVKEVPDQQVN